MLVLHCWIQRRQSQLHQLDHGITCVIRTNGNTNVSCGDVIEFNLPAVAAAKAEENRKFDVFYRGRFLVRRIRQDFDFGSQKHESILTIVKDSLETQLTTVDESIETFPVNEDPIVAEFYGRVDPTSE